MISENYLEKLKKNIPSKDYFGEREELAIKEFLSTSDLKKREYLFKDIIDPTFKELIEGVLKMPMFQKMIGINTTLLKEDAYSFLIEQMGKFDPSRIGKDGNPAKAYSFYGTTVKNFCLLRKIKSDKKIAEIGGDLDVEQFANVIEDKDRTIEMFRELNKDIIKFLEDYKELEECKKNDLIVCNCLIYMLNKWDKLEFKNKNEFLRLLIQYTSLKNNITSSSFKKIKQYLNKNLVL